MSTTLDPIEVTTVDVPSVSDEEGRRREILLRAAEIVESDGYRSGPEGMRIGHGPVCLLGAVGRAADVDTFYSSSDSVLHYRMDSAASLLMGRPVSLKEVPEYYGWSDSLRYEKGLPRVPVQWSIWHPFTDSRQMKPGEVVARTLRRLANGESWETAARIR